MSLWRCSNVLVEICGDFNDFRFKWFGQTVMFYRGVVEVCIKPLWLRGVHRRCSLLAALCFGGFEVVHLCTLTPKHLNPKQLN